MDQLKKNLPILILLIGSFLTIWPLFQPGFFPMHDDTQPTRVYEMAEALRDGQFPVRWVKDLGYGYGYPLFNFYAPLPYYFGAIAVILGLPLLVATKLMFGLGMILAGITMFFCAKKLWGDWGGVISSLLYTFAPYHAVQLYVRGAVGELWAYGLLPLIFLGIFLGKTDLRKGILAGSLGLAGVILSHNITALILAGFLTLLLIVKTILFFLGSRNSGSKLLVPVCIIALGMGLASFFWLPAIAEIGLTRAYTLIEGTNNFRDHFVFLDQLWNSPWGFAGSSQGRLDGMSFMVGKVHIFLGLAGLVGVFLANRTNKTNVTSKGWKKIIFFVIGLGASVYMLLPQSQIVWELIPPLAYIQYPWRFLVFVAFLLSLLGGGAMFALGKITEKKIVWLAVICVLLIVGFNRKYFQPQFVSSKTVADYTDTKMIRETISRISDEYLPKEFPKSASLTISSSPAIITPDGIMVEQLSRKSHLWDAVISADMGAEIVFSLAYFPGWKFYIDAQEVGPRIVDGRPHIAVPAGRHILKATFTNTPVRNTSNMVTLASLVAIFALAMRIREKGNTYEKS